MCLVVAIRYDSSAAGEKAANKVRIVNYEKVKTLPTKN
jgi:hypothetical protein